MELPVKVARVTLGYHELEDRLVLFVTGDDQQNMSLHITRRMTARMIDHLAQILERTNVLATKSPAETRAEIVLMERQVALADTRPGASPDQDGSQTPSPANGLDSQTAGTRLVARIDVKIEPNGFLLVFFDATGEVANLRIGRLKLHSLVEFMRRTVESAAWNLQFGTAWLNAEQTKFSIN